MSGSLEDCSFHSPGALAVDRLGRTIVVCETDANCVRRIDLKAGSVSTLCGRLPSRSDAIAPDALVEGWDCEVPLVAPRGVCLHPSTSLAAVLISDSGHSAIRLFTPARSLCVPVPIAQQSAEANAESTASASAEAASVSDANSNASAASGEQQQHQQSQQPKLLQRVAWRSLTEMLDDWWSVMPRPLRAILLDYLGGYVTTIVGERALQTRARQLRERQATAVAANVGNIANASTADADDAKGDAKTAAIKAHSANSIEEQPRPAPKNSQWMSSPFMRGNESWSWTLEESAASTTPSAAPMLEMKPMPAAVR